MKLLSSLAFAFSLPSLVLSQDAAPRTALVMGVGDYSGSKYKGKAIQTLPGITTADLPNMEAKLKALGFSVTVVADPTLSQAKMAVDAFSARIKTRPGVSLFYFSGHGGEYEGKNYLIPRGASIGSTADLSDEALSAQRVLNGMEESGAQVNLVFLDCCREDLGKNIGGAELAPLNAKGSFIGFATRSGDFADPEEQGSPYTRFLLKHLDKPGVSVSDMYGFVVRDVGEYSKKILGEERRPGFYSELAGEPFYFVPVKFTPPPSQPDSASVEAEIERRARELAAKMSDTSKVPPLTSPAPGDAQTAPTMASVLNPAPTPAAMISPDAPPATIHSLDELFDGTRYDSFNRYSRSAVLRKAQEKLKTAGLYRSVVDGESGPGTCAAIRLWQTQQGLPATGALDTVTLQIMALDKEAQIDPPVSKPERNDPGAERRPPAPSPVPGLPQRSPLSILEEQYRNGQIGRQGYEQQKAKIMMQGR